MERTSNETYFCVLCPSNPQVLCFKTKSELETHLREIHFVENLETERPQTDVFIERHIKYQEMLNKLMSQPIKTIPDRYKKLYKGCPVCDRIIEVFNIHDKPYPKGPDAHELQVGDIHVDYPGNNVNHINPHLKYYPFECLKCKDFENSRYKNDSDLKDVESYCKTANKAMMRRHVIDKHLKHSPLTRGDFEKQVEDSIITLKIMVLERITQTVLPVRPTKRRPKMKTTPGPLRKSVKLEPTKYLTSIAPTFNQTIFLSAGSLRNTISYPIQCTLGPIEQVMPMRQTYALIPCATPISLVRSAVITPKKSELKIFLENEVPITNEKTRNNWKESDSNEMMYTSSEDEVSDEKFFGCVFCLKKLNNYEKALEHYSVHMNNFIECTKCDLKFSTISDFRLHNEKHNHLSNLSKVGPFLSVRKWIQNFLNIQNSEFKQKLLDLTCNAYRVYCPVCVMVYNVFNYESNKILPKDQTIETHIQQHLQYLSFECVECTVDRSEIKAFYSDLDVKTHLFKEHHIDNAMDMRTEELTKYFSRSNTTIAYLDEIIGKCQEINSNINDYFQLNEKFKKMSFKTI